MGKRRRAALTNFVHTCARSRAGQVVHVVTGRGNRSPGAPVLKPMVGEMLDGDLARWIAAWRLAPDGGSYLVRLKQERTE